MIAGLLCFVTSRRPRTPFEAAFHCIPYNCCSVRRWDFPTRLSPGRRDRRVRGPGRSPIWPARRPPAATAQAAFYAVDSLAQGPHSAMALPVTTAPRASRFGLLPLPPRPSTGPTEVTARSVSIAFISASRPPLLLPGQRPERGGLELRRQPWLYAAEHFTSRRATTRSRLAGELRTGRWPRRGRSNLPAWPAQSWGLVPKLRTTRLAARYEVRKAFEHARSRHVVRSWGIPSNHAVESRLSTPELSTTSPPRHHGDDEPSSARLENSRRVDAFGAKKQGVGPGGGPAPPSRRYLTTFRAKSSPAQAPKGGARPMSDDAHARPRGRRAILRMRQPPPGVALCRSSHWGDLLRRTADKD